MQNNNMNHNGAAPLQNTGSMHAMPYAPQNTGAMNPVPYVPQTTGTMNPVQPYMTQNTGAMNPVAYQPTAPLSPVSMNTVPYPPQPDSPAPEQATLPMRAKAFWQLLNPAAVALLIALILGFAYALYVTCTLWWFGKVIPHLVLVWLSVALNALALLRGKQTLMLAAAVCYGISLIFFINYFYLLLIQPILCLVAWWRTNE